MPLKVENHQDKRKAKFFTGGKPKNFELTPDSSSDWKLGAALRPSGSSYTISLNGNMCAKSLREVGEHLTELADVIEGKVAA